MPMFRRLMIANRGEIACRIALTCRKLGIEAVGVFSEADADARHVRWLDRAVRLDGQDPRAVYLDAAQIIAVALDRGCDAVHPGYGFLAENAPFAEAVATAGLGFIGPGPEAIRAMGDKDRAREIAAAAGVPIVPGAVLPLRQEAAAAASLGYPLLLKPAAGGGGKGMQVVREPEALADAVAAARRIATAAFGDATLIAERLLDRCRHIEVQVMADHHGRILTAFERDCSLQRRHQKLIEEAPAPNLDPARRQDLARDARRIAEAVGYRNLGTVEFLVTEAGHWFIEMNTRLQVEHPVTEAITGLDLVEWQLRIAAGEALPADLVPETPIGHAIEARLNAEDPDNGFLPATGRLDRLALPTERVRVDAGIDAGDVVGEHFDPLLAKLVAHGPDRETARLTLARALDATVVEGVATNRRFVQGVLDHPDFTLGRIHTAWLAERSDDWTFPLPAAEFAALVLATSDRERTGWAAASGLRLNAPPAFRYRLRSGGTEIEQPLVLDFPHALKGGRGWIERDGVRLGFGYTLEGARVTVEAANSVRSFSIAAAAVTGRRSEAEGTLVAPMPGKITALAATPGQAVAAGALLAVVEAMKMEHPITAPFAGTVAAVHVTLGGQVEEGTTLVELERTGPPC